MPVFTNQVPDDPRGYALPLLRCPTGRPFVSIIISDDLLGCATHFWGGRTVPHEELDCEPCNNGNPWRWHSYMACYSPKLDDSCILESTRRVSKMLTKYRQTHGTLRGCHFRGQRRTSARNSRVNIELKPADLRSIRLPEPPNMLACMAIIWNLKLDDLQVDCVIEDVPAISTRTTPDQVEPLANQLPLKFQDEDRSKSA